MNSAPLTERKNIAYMYRPARPVDLSCTQMPLCLYADSLCANYPQHIKSQIPLRYPGRRQVRSWSHRRRRASSLLARCWRARW